MVAALLLFDNQVSDLDHVVDPWCSGRSCSGNQLG
jgi:hypothetical protein